MAVSRLAPVLALAVSLAALGPARSSAGSSLAVWDAGAWHTWWRADQTPSRWPAADSTVGHALEWRTLAPGLEWASVRLACDGPVWRTRLIVARLDPRRVSLSLEMDLDRDHRPAWTVDRAPHDALLAVNAGQFVGAMPWGWVVSGGRQRLRPGFGPLASAVAVDTAGRVRWVHGDTLAAEAGIVAGFQSYPTLLSGDGLVPEALRAGDQVNLHHRDTRLALGETRDGRLVVVMTRFDAIGGIAAEFPLGPTTPEMAAIMGALGARDAVMLDGGISAQLLLREPGRQEFRWRGLRKVPLALIARPRPAGQTR
jgi:hypothetical protein